MEPIYWDDRSGEIARPTTRLESQKLRSPARRLEPSFMSGLRLGMESRRYQTEANQRGGGNGSKPNLRALRPSAALRGAKGV